MLQEAPNESVKSPLVTHTLDEFAKINKLTDKSSIQSFFDNFASIENIEARKKFD